MEEVPGVELARRQCRKIADRILYRYVPLGRMARPLKGDIAVQRRQ